MNRQRQRSRHYFFNHLCQDIRRLGSNPDVDFMILLNLITRLQYTKGERNASCRYRKKMQSNYMDFARHANQSQPKNIMQETQIL